jgi:hypothetical protein
MEGEMFTVGINSLTLNAGATLGIQGAGSTGNSLQLENGMTNNGTITVNTGGTGANLVLAAGPLSGTGTIDLNAATTGAQLSFPAAGLTSTNTIDGEGEIFGTFTNNGTVDASGTSAMLLGSTSAGGLSMTNNTVIESSGSGLDLGTTNGSANITQGTTGTIVAASNLANAITLANATITNGTCTQAMGFSGGFQVAGSATLTSVTLDAPLVVASGVLSIGTSLTDNSTITVGNGTSGATMSFGSLSTLSGSGSIVMAGSGADPALIEGSFTNSGLTISGYGTINSNVTNNGTFDANSSGHTLTLQSAIETNNGTIESTGGVLVVQTAVSQGSGGQIDAASGTVVLQSALLTGGSLATSGGVVTVSGQTTLTSVTNKGTLTVPHGSTIVISGGLTNSGNITGGGIISGTVAGNGTLTSTEPAPVGQMVLAGMLTGDGAISVAAQAELRIASSSGQSTVASLSIGSNGILDLTNNSLLINYGSNADPISSVQAWLASGYSGGVWGGPGIDSSTAAATPGTYGIGYADSADAGNPAGLSSGSILVEYTLLGDANLDRTVNGVDFGILAANFNKGVTAWDKGDFNYDNAVNGVDFGLLAANFNKGASGAADVAALDAFAAANGLLADVPEPASTGVLMFAVMGTLGVVPRRWRGDKR